jgi:hypothetical protein
MTKNFQIVMPEKSHRELKAMAAMRGLKIGDVVTGLVNFSKSGQMLKDKALRDRFENMLELQLLNIGVDGWSD